MGAIHILNTELSNKIAAGEVVERPASVIKELVENSIDASASCITVEIQDGGITYMRVTDNGCGMSREDAEIAFLRHATSKITTDSDLDAIYTLGFRGEALSSIAAVAKVDLFTKTADKDEGVLVQAQGGEIVTSDSAGTPVGTTIVVRDLFFNTPARMKFLKKNSTEAGYIADIMSRFILAHPEISFKFINGSKEQLFSSGNNKLTDCIYTVYGRDYAKSTVDVCYDGDCVSVTGAVGKSEVSRPNRNFQSFFINGRYIKSPLIIRAIEEAYKNQIMIGKFPMAILNLKINPSLIDINVHPTKLEVKFSNEGQVYEAVYFAVKNALYQTVNIPKIESKKDTQTIFDKPKNSDYSQLSFAVAKQSVPQRTIQPKNDTETEQKPAVDYYKQSVQKKTAVSALDLNFDFDGGVTAKQERAKYDLTDTDKSSEVSPDTENIEKMSSDTAKTESIISAEPKHSVPTSDNEIFSDTGEARADYKIVGQIFETYIIAERENEMLIIDQHAAHERLKYEALKRNCENGSISPQILLVPVVVTLSASEFSVYKENTEFLLKLGLETDEFGDNSIVVRSIPMDMDENATAELIVELLSQLEGSKRELITAKEDRAMYTVACKAAIKANHRLHKDEMKSLLDDIFALPNINTCPHGRPIIVSMSKKELEKEFKRIV